MGEDLSRLRQRLWASHRGLGSLLRLLGRDPPMVQGTLYLLRRKCGKAGCRCAAGQLHATWVITRSESGRQRIYTVPAESRGRLRALTREYRLWQRARARLVKRCAEMLALVDAIAEGRLRAWPPERGEEEDGSGVR